VHHTVRGLEIHAIRADRDDHSAKRARSRVDDDFVTTRRELAREVSKGTCVGPVLDRRACPVLFVGSQLGAKPGAHLREIQGRGNGA
jgi:hypothetical protein